MKTYTMEVKVTFTGTIQVKADTKREAREIANRDWGVTINNAHTSNDEHVVDWDMDMTPETKTFK